MRLRGAGSLDVIGLLEQSEELRRELLQNGMAALAARLETSERTLRRRFAECGVRPVDYVRKARRQALERLLAWDASPETMAKAVGFQSPAAVQRFLRREFGTRVRELRRRLSRTPPSGRRRPASPSSSSPTTSR